MQAFGKSQAVRRVEDLRFLTGQGRYIDDVAPAGALYAYFLRSPVAHAEITELAVGDAREVPGVVAVLTQADLEAAGMRPGMNARRMPNGDGSDSAAPLRPVMARGRVRFVGEAVAMVLAETPEAARDAAEAILVDYDDLPVKLEVAPGGPVIHDEASENVAIDYVAGRPDETRKALEDAAHRLRYTIADNRIIPNSMEPRGAVAHWDDEGRLHCAFGGQNVWALKDHLVQSFALEPEQVHVTIPDVGGGFGTKAMVYPEYLAICAGARVAGRPVRWVAERGESMLTDNAGRDLVSTVEMGFDESGRLLAYHVDNLFNLGAYNSGFGQGIQTFLFSRVLMGVYDCQAASLRSRGIYTNTTQVDAYRGAGRPEAIYTLERAMDYAARDLGLDPWELRRRNFIPTDAFPYETVTGETYDVGDFHRVLDRVETACERAGFAARKDEAAKRGRLLGQGLCFYIESILGDPSENVDITFDEDGGATIRVGTQSNGQGHETVMIQYLADHTGIPPEKIRFVQGDSDLIPAGGGTGGSRSITVQTNVTLHTLRRMVAEYREFLAGEMGVSPEDVTFDDERFRADGSNLTPSFLDAAEMARAAGRTDLLRFKQTEKLPARSFPNGAHVAEVEIDPETGALEVARYTVVDDFGNLINPLLAEGQVHGGVAQGIGQAVQEHVVFDEDGQLLTASFMDYAIPRARDLPMVGFQTEPVPSTANPLGMKGCGEAGTVGALAAVANGALDAMWDAGVREADMPFTPMRVWQMLREAGTGHDGAAA